MSHDLSPSLTHEWLTSWLRTLPASDLSRLLQLRDDAAVPTPPNFTSLATRLLLPASLRRALSTLSAFEIAVIETAAKAGAEFHTLTSADLEKLLGSRLQPAPSHEAFSAALTMLIDAGLIISSPTDHSELRLPTEVLANLPAGFSLIDHDDPTDALPKELRTTAKEVLTTLAHAGGVGTSADAAPEADPSRPIPALINAGLLQRINATTVRLPTEVLRALRRDQQASGIQVNPPDYSAAGTEISQQSIDDAATAQGLEVVRLTARLIDVLSHSPVPTLHNGEIGVRDLTRLAKSLEVTESEAVKIITTAMSAQLIGTGYPDTDDERPSTALLAVCPQADEWLKADPAHRWAHMITGWWNSGWANHRVGEKLSSGTLRLLSPETKEQKLPELRQRLTISTTTHSGIALSANQESTAFAFRWPLNFATTQQGELAELIAESAWIGLYAAGAASSPALLITDTDLPDTEMLAATCATLVPKPVEQVIIQADMTILSPGPLPHELEKEVGLFADLESPGLASIYRISEASVRRALDAGRSGADITAFLGEHAIGSVPQAVSYLINDTAAHHGAMRGGPAGCYLRSSDSTMLAAAVNSPVGQALGLRLLADTVAVSPKHLAEVIEGLSASGVHAAAEDAEGHSVDIRPAPVRLPEGKRRRTDTTAPLAERLPGIVEKLLHHRDPGENSAPTPEESPIALLKAAARAGLDVEVGYVGAGGQARTRRLTPVRISPGQLDAVDSVTGSAHRFPMHRITGVSVVDDPGGKLPDDSV